MLAAGALIAVAVVAGVVVGVSALAGGNNTPGVSFNEVEIDPDADNKYHTRRCLTALLYFQTHPPA